MTNEQDLNHLTNDGDNNIDIGILLAYPIATAVAVYLFSPAAYGFVNSLWWSITHLGEPWPTPLPGPPPDDGGITIGCKKAIITHVHESNCYGCYLVEVEQCDGYRCKQIIPLIDPYEELKDCNISPTEAEQIRSDIEEWRFSGGGPESPLIIFL